ncbi:MAG: ribonuclease III [Desulfovibrionaceae bacterium]
MTERNITKLEKNIVYTFYNKDLLKESLTHSSYASESHSPFFHNERLEFLGDSILNSIITTYLFTHFTCKREGSLSEIRSSLTNNSFLSTIAIQITLEQCILLGKGEERQQGRQRKSLLSDAFEALIGAIYMDSSFNTTYDIITRLFQPHFKEIKQNSSIRDNKSILQEKIQKLFKTHPIYTLLQSTGKDHAPDFYISLLLPDKTIFYAQEKSIKKAEQNAASQALEYLDSLL